MRGKAPRGLCWRVKCVSAGQPCSAEMHSTVRTMSLIEDVTSFEEIPVCNAILAQCPALARQRGADEMRTTRVLPRRRSVCILAGAQTGRPQMAQAILLLEDRDFDSPPDC